MGDARVITLPEFSGERLNECQIKAFLKMKLLLSDVSAADLMYDRLPLSEKGKVISTDIARYLDANYVKEPEKGKCRDILPSWDLAWRYAQNRLEHEIINRGKRRKLRLMAGGWGAGKTFALRNESEEKTDLIWDGTLSDITWAVEMIRLALDHQWQVEIAYVFRDIELAIYGAVERKREVGREVPITKLPKVHRNVQQSILKLTEIYRTEKKVSFLYLHNLGTQSVKSCAPEIDLIDLEQYGALHYLKRYEDYYTEASKKIEQADAS
jgi:hypothetical protein